jgi:hypothetical protein
MKFKLWFENIEEDVYYHVTKSNNIDSIMKNGLMPSVGDRSKKMNERPSIFLFKSIQDVEDAMMNWLGDELEDHPATLLKIKIPQHVQIYPTSAGYESQVFDHIPPDYIQNLGEI